MALSDELARLHELHQSGGLSDDEYARAKERLLSGSPGASSGAPPDGAPLVRGLNALRRTRGDRWIAGVCGGLAVATGVESWIWRLLFAVAAIFAGTGVLLYLLMWIFVPEE